MTATTLPPEILRRIGEAAYGERWQSALAEAFGVSDRVVRRWLAGSATFPPARIADLIRLLQTRRRDIDLAERELLALLP